MSLETALALLAGLLALSAFFSSSETALFSLNRIQLRRMQAGRGGRERAVVRLLEHPAHVLSAILVGNTLVNVAFSALTTDFLLELLSLTPGHAAGLATLVSSLLILLVGEVTPKTLAIRFAEPFARFEARPLRLVVFLLRPLTALLSGIAHSVLRLIGISDPLAGTGALTPGDLRVLLEEVGEDAVLSNEERRIAGRIFEFSSTRANEVMTPRVDIRSADRRVSPEALADVIRSSRHTRIPISDGSIDQILGFINAKEYLLNPGATLEELLKPVLFVPETKPANEIFHEIQRRRIGMVVVVDEYGHTAGIITKEDLVEEIVGEIYDEYESDQKPIVKVGPDRYMVTGQVTVAELAEELGVELAAEAVTLNGFLAEQLRGIPRAGDRVEHEGLEFRVLEVRRHRVHRCEVRRLPAPVSTEGAPTEADAAKGAGSAGGADPGQAVGPGTGGKRR